MLQILFSNPSTVSSRFLLKVPALLISTSNCGWVHTSFSKNMDGLYRCQIQFHNLNIRITCIHSETITYLASHCDVSTTYHDGCTQRNKLLGRGKANPTVSTSNKNFFLSHLIPRKHSIRTGDDQDKYHPLLTDIYIL